MRTISARALALAALALPLTTPAYAQGRFIPDAEQVELLCPSIGLNGLRLGTDRSAEDPEAVKELEGQAPDPLTNAVINYTPWSQRLASITWQGAGFEGMEDFPWRSGVSEALEMDGWTLFHASEDEEFLPSSEYRKTIATGDGPREFAVTLASNGNFELSCGDAGLMDLSEEEAMGNLAQGSPRPVPPPADWGQQADAWLAGFDCTSPALVAAFDELGRLNESISLITAQVGEPPELGADSDYQTRLATWLKWTIRNSDKVSEEAFWAMEERAVTYDSDEVNEDFVALVGAATALLEAEQAPDGASRCNGVRSFFTGMRASSAREATRTERANQIRIAEARKLGITVD